MSTLRLSWGVNRGYTKVPAPSFPPERRINIPVRQEFFRDFSPPNPFRSGTEIRFSLPSQSRVKLGVFDLAGRQVATLSDQLWEPGNHSLNWSGRLDGGALARGGVYIVQMVATSTTDGGNYRSQKKMIRIE